jgi:hypothetical protein
VHRRKQLQNVADRHWEGRRTRRDIERLGVVDSVALAAPQNSAAVATTTAGIGSLVLVGLLGAVGFVFQSRKDPV